mgnify:CR=1 FL=1
MRADVSRRSKRMGWNLRRPGACLVVAAAVTVAGCSEELGPEVIPKTPFSGRVVVSGRPVPRGWVELQPLDGTLGDPTSARIRDDGRFEFPAAPLGEVMIRLIDAPLDVPAPVWFFRNSSPIRRTTQSPPGPPTTIDVLEELIRHQAASEPAR